MKKLLAIPCLLVVLLLSGCGSTTTEPSAEHTMYFQNGRYYFTADLQGQVLTNDGNIWDYTQDVISEEPSYHNEPVIAVIDDNGTPDTVEDDAILGLVLDRETAIYDALEASLSESFKLERDGNNIRIQELKIK